MDDQDKTPETHERILFMRRRRYQKGSLQKRKQGHSMVWGALWWEEGIRRYRTLGKCSEMSQGRARFMLDDARRGHAARESDGSRTAEDEELHVEGVCEGEISAVLR